jgi:hypothetical protein
MTGNLSTHKRPISSSELDKLDNKPYTGPRPVYFFASERSKKWLS